MTACGLPSALWAQSSGGSLDDVLLNLGPATEADVRIIAAGQANDPAGPKYPSVAVEQRTFTGLFTPASVTTQLAIFSDDGCDVSVDRTKIHTRLSVGQALPDLGQSFHLVTPSQPWEPGRAYLVRVDYSNTIYQGLTDIDGATLFAFNGGGSVLLETWNWEPGVSPADDEESPLIVTINGEQILDPDAGPIYVVPGEVVEIEANAYDLDTRRSSSGSTQSELDDIGLIVSSSDGAFDQERISGPTFQWAAPELLSGSEELMVDLNVQVDDDSTTAPGAPLDGHTGNRDDNPGEHRGLQFVVALAPKGAKYRPGPAMEFYYQAADSTNEVGEGGTSPPSGAKVRPGQKVLIGIAVKDNDEVLPPGAPA